MIGETIEKYREINPFSKELTGRMTFFLAAWNNKAMQDEKRRIDMQHPLSPKSMDW